MFPGRCCRWLRDLLDTLLIMLVELSVVEQRYQAVLAVIGDGESVTSVAGRFGVSRQTVHSWLARYEASGLAGLTDRSSRPRSSPNQMAPESEAMVLEMRRAHPGWGPRRLVHELARAGVDPVPSRSGVYRALRRAGVIEQQPRRKRDEKWKRWERAEPMELWQLDVVGGIALDDGTLLKAVTGVDDHSRFIVIAGLMRRENSRRVCEFFAEAMRRYGVPQQVLTDNGKVFTGKYHHPAPVEVLFDRVCRENGVDHILTKPAHPTTTGKIERFHRSLRSEFLTGRSFPDMRTAQRQLDAWVHDYNHQRPHQGIQMASPAQRFLAGLSEPVAGMEFSAQSMVIDRDPEAWVTRRVATNGIVCVNWQQISVGKHRAGDNVDVHVQEKILQIWSGSELLKTVVRTSEGQVRKKKASVNRYK